MAQRQFAARQQDACGAQVKVRRTVGKGFGEGGVAGTPGRRPGRARPGGSHENTRQPAAFLTSLGAPASRPRPTHGRANALAPANVISRAAWKRASRRKFNPPSSSAAARRVPRGNDRIHQGLPATRGSPRRSAKSSSAPTVRSRVRETPMQVRQHGAGVRRVGRHRPGFRKARPEATACSCERGPLPIATACRSSATASSRRPKARVTCEQSVSEITIATGLVWVLRLFSASSCSAVASSRRFKSTAKREAAAGISSTRNWPTS